MKHAMTVPDIQRFAVGSNWQYYYGYTEFVLFQCIPRCILVEKFHYKSFFKNSSLKFMLMSYTIYIASISELSTCF